MAAISDLNINVKKDSRFNNTDYVLLISTICGFGLLLIGLVVIMVGRRFRSQNSNNAADVEIQSVDNINGEAMRLISKSPIITRDSQDLNNSKRGDIANATDEYMDMDGYTNDANDSPDNEEQYTKLNEDLFKFMYPQYTHYDIFKSINNAPVNQKTMLSITEITNEEEEIESKANENDETIICGGDTSCIKGKEERELEQINEGSVELKDIIQRDQVDLALRLVVNINSKSIDIDEEKQRVFFENESVEKLSNVTKDSDEDSFQEITTSSKLTCASSSYSSNISPALDDFVEEPKTIVEKLLIIRSSNDGLDQIDKDLNSVSAELNSLPKLGDLDILNNKTEVHIDNKMSVRVESLQNDITTFLQRCYNFDEINDVKECIKDDDSNDYEKKCLLDVETDEDILRPISASNIEYINSFETSVSNCDQGNFIKSAGDNIHQDEMLREPSDSSTSTYWPGRNQEASNTDTIHRVDTDSLHNHPISLLDSVDDDRKVPRESIESFITQEISPHQKLSEDSEISRNLIDFGEIPVNRLSEDVPEKERKDLNRQVIEEIKNRAAELDSSVGSTDLLVQSKIVHQTNKNAFTGGENLNLSAKHTCRNRNVQETVKLFENAAFKSPNNDFKTSLRLHKKRK